MSTHAPDAGAPHTDPTDERNAALRMADDAVVVYGQSNHRAWVQSSLTVALEDLDRGWIFTASRSGGQTAIGHLSVRAVWGPFRTARVPDQPRSTSSWPFPPATAYRSGAVGRTLRSIHSAVEVGERGRGSARNRARSRFERI